MYVVGKKEHITKQRAIYLTLSDNNIAFIYTSRALLQKCFLFLFLSGCTTIQKPEAKKKEKKRKRKKQRQNETKKREKTKQEKKERRSVLNVRVMRHIKLIFETETRTVQSRSLSVLPLVY